MSKFKFAKLLKRLVGQHPRDKDIPECIAKSDAEIRLQWTHGAETGASQGTWTHASFECLPNGGFIAAYDEEVSLFRKFLEPLAHFVARGFLLCRAFEKLYDHGLLDATVGREAI